MKELGSYLKEVRESNGVSIDEAADDLDIDVFLLESLEDGNIRAFKDVLGIRDIVKAYSKYLGLKSEEVLDEFNDFLFEHTSKISLNDILEAEKEEKNKSKEIHSPYTYTKKKKISHSKLKLLAIWVLFIFALIIFFVVLYRPKKEPIVNELLIGSGIYEKFTK